MRTTMLSSCVRTRRCSPVAICHLVAPSEATGREELNSSIKTPLMSQGSGLTNGDTVVISIRIVEYLADVDDPLVL
jgi:hypothetical protein